MPRHPERSVSVLKAMDEKNINTKVSSTIPNEMNLLNAVVINATGLLNSLYQMADIAFIGGSLLSKYGGHNIIEPASNKCAHLLEAGSIMLCPPYLLNKLPPIKAISAIW